MPLKAKQDLKPKLLNWIYFKHLLLMSNDLYTHHFICTRILWDRYYDYTLLRDEKTEAHRSLIILSWSTLTLTQHQNVGSGSLTMVYNFHCSVVWTIFLCSLHPFSHCISCLHTHWKLVNILYYSNMGARFLRVPQINLPDTPSQHQVKANWVCFIEKLSEHILIYLELKSVEHYW